MELTHITKAISIGVFLAFMLGPVFFMLIQTSIIKGFRAAFVFDIGVILADVAFLYLAYFGSRGVLEQVKDNPMLFYVGGVIMIAYGLIMYFLQKGKEIIQDETLVVTTSPNYFQLFLKGFFLNFINVGVLGFWIGMVVIYSTEFQMDNQKVFNFFAVVVLAYLATDIGKILLAKKLRKKMTPAFIFKMKHVMGVILVVFGIFLVLKGAY